MDTWHFLIFKKQLINNSIPQNKQDLLVVIIPSQLVFVSSLFYSQNQDFIATYPLTCLREIDSWSVNVLKKQTCQGKDSTNQFSFYLLVAPLDHLNV